MDKKDKIIFYIRNIFVIVASVLLVLSFFLNESEHMLRGYGYVFGALAYFSELYIMSEGFKRIDANEHFMAYVFFPIYVLMALSYFGIID